MIGIVKRRWVGFGRIRQQAIEDIQQLTDACAGARADETDRHQMPFAQALLEGIVQLLRRQGFFAGIEISAHGGFVDLHHLVENLLMRFGQR